MDNNCQIAQEGNAQTWLLYNSTYFRVLLAKCVVSIMKTHFSNKFLCFLSNVFLQTLHHLWALINS